ncbi:conserved hypothetical protein [Hyella patelloides LEGE 07179]|uniref:Uncharacterized protein n=1 Tax=Hyella patelloides LEGE 07179 TaxID=945734 RepID=A0A563W1T3_9CYAN|nr:HD domain-containing protein [Hyella patelloides]VEP17662.1 conserved hypothetical protein [Hyella patelloides LEGE 07179]
MEIEEVLKIAQKLATDAHKEQTDKAGKPYISHCQAVAAQLNTTEEKIVGWLHDIVEDTKITFIDLEKEGIPEHLIDAIKAITKISGELYEHYLERVKENKIALSVKIADMRHNCDLSRISNPTAKDYARLSKYQKILPDLIKYQQESE